MSQIEVKIVEHDKTLSVMSFQWQQARTKDKATHMRAIDNMLDNRLDLMAIRDGKALSK